MSAAPGSGSGTGYSRISNGLPVPWNTAIRAVSAMEDLLWWPVSYRNGRARLARVELVDVFDERANLQCLGEVVRQVQLAPRGLQPLDRDQPLLHQHHRERVDLGRELLDDVRIATAEAGADPCGEKILLGGGVGHGRQGGEQTAAEPAGGARDR